MQKMWKNFFLLAALSEKETETLNKEKAHKKKRNRKDHKFAFRTGLSEKKSSGM